MLKLVSEQRCPLWRDKRLPNDHTASIYVPGVDGSTGVFNGSITGSQSLCTGTTIPDMPAALLEVRGNRMTGGGLPQRSSLNALI